MDVLGSGISSALGAAGLAAFEGGETSTSRMAMLAVAVLGLTILMVSTYRRTRQTRSAPRVSPREQYEGLQRESVARRDLEHVMVELDELARQIHGRVDTRVAKLEMVLRDADDRIARLTRLVKAADGGASVDVTVGDSEERTAEGGPADREPHAAVCRLAESGLSPGDIGARVGKTVGEVELILALSRAKRDATAAPGIVTHAAARA